MSETASANRERIKRESDFLRGRLAEELADETTDHVSEEAAQILAFHGVIAGYDRDTAAARDKAGLAPDAMYSVHIACPEGFLTSTQYLGLDALAVEHADGTLRVARGHTIVMHHVRKSSLKPLIAGIHQLGFTSFARAGDLVLPISYPALPVGDLIHLAIAEDARNLNQLRLPKTNAYNELWLGAEINHGQEMNPEPLYSKSYLPSPLSVTIATHPGDALALADDVVLIAQLDEEKLAGYHLLIGGDLSQTPALAEPLAWVPRDRLAETMEALIKLWRDHGRRGDQQQPSLRALIASRGMAWVKQTLDGYLLSKMPPPTAMTLTTVKPRYGWQQGLDGSAYAEIPLLAGRIMNHDGESLQTLLADICGEFEVSLYLTQRNHVILAGIKEEQRLAIEYKLRRHGVMPASESNPLKSQLIGCAALPICAKAKAESERILPLLLGELEQLMERYGVLGEPVSVHVAGCDAGCARARLGEIGLIGIAPSRYDLYVGGNQQGTRLNELLFADVALAHIAGALEPVIALWSSSREAGESLGDFCARIGASAIKQAAEAHLAKRHWVN